MSDWEKYSGNPVLGGQLGTCFDMSVSMVDGGYRMWFSWRPKASIGYAVSKDGLHWQASPEPVLSPDPGSPVEDVEVTRPYVLPESGGYTMWYAGHSPDQVVICRATSRDGLQWQRHGAVLEPQLPWEKAALMCPSVLRDESGTYHLWYSGGERYEPDAIGYATSRDGISWKRVGDGPVLRPDPACGWERERVAGAHVFARDGWLYAAYIGFANGFEDSAIGIARSADGINWRRHAGNPVLNRGDAGEFDSINVYKPFVIIEGDLWRLWYNASAPRVGTDTSHDNRIEQVGHAQCRFAFQPVTDSLRIPGGSAL